MPHDQKFLNLQGLRAVAAVSVIAFHFGLPLQGGFLGVDLFFLISGFIIPYTLFREYDKNGRINLKSFYRRRLHRLFPASILVIVLTLSIVLLISTPEIKTITASSSLAGLLISVNYLVAAIGNDYFSPAAELNPLLHFWSLSVEEQIYLLLALSIGIMQLKRLHNSSIKKAAYAVLVTLSVLSLILFLGEKSTWQDSNLLLSYYSTVIRLWEFSFGFSLLLLFRKFGPRTRRTSIYLEFLLLALCGYLLLSTSGTSTESGVRTVIFLFAACYFVYPTSNQAELNQKILESRVFQYLGDRSYSLYLIHWPVVVLLKAIGFTGHRLSAIAFFLTLLLSVLTYLLIEKRFRKINSRNTVIIFVSFIFAVSFSVLAIFMASQNLKQYTDTLASKERYIGEIGHKPFFDYLYKNMYQCDPESIRNNATNEGYLRCWQSKNKPEQDVALFGDSHSEHLFPGFADSFPDLNVVYFDALDEPTNTSPQARRIVEYLERDNNIKHVIISAYWNTRGIKVDELRSLVTRLIASGKSVYLTSDVPVFQGDPFNCKYGVNPELISREVCESSFGSQPQITSSNIAKLNEVTAGFPKAAILNITDYFCTQDLGRCSMVKKGRILYRDSNHLNVLGSIALVEELLEGGALKRITQSSG